MTKAQPVDQREYCVTWQIYIGAASAEEAVIQAINRLGPMKPEGWCYLARDREKGEVSRHKGNELF